MSLRFIGLKTWLLRSSFLYHIWWVNPFSSLSSSWRESLHYNHIMGKPLLVFAVAARVWTQESHSHFGAESWFDVGMSLLYITRKTTYHSHRVRMHRRRVTVFFFLWHKVWLPFILFSRTTNQWFIKGQSLYIFFFPAFEMRKCQSFFPLRRCSESWFTVGMSQLFIGLKNMTIAISIFISLIWWVNPFHLCRCSGSLDTTGLWFLYHWWVNLS